MELLDKFPVEGGQKDPKRRIIPFLPGKRLTPSSFTHIHTTFTCNNNKHLNLKTVFLPLVMSHTLFAAQVECFGEYSYSLVDLTIYGL